MSIYDSTIEGFWREHNTMFKYHFLEQFRNFKFMGILKTTKNFDIWLLHVVHMQEINNKIEAMTTIHMNHSLCTEDNKYGLQTCQTSIL